MGDGGLDVGRSVIAHAPGELVADSDTATADESRMLEGNSPLLQPGDCHGNLPRRAWRVAALNSAVQ